MTKTRLSRKTLQERVRPWLIALGLAQATLRVGGRLCAHRLDVGDEASGELRRVQTLGSVVLRPTSQALSRLQLDLVLAGAEIDLTHAQPGPGGIDMTLNCTFAGANVRVPSGWKVSWDSRGLGGVDTKKLTTPDVEQDAATADLRVHLRAAFGGVSLSS